MPGVPPILECVPNVSEGRDPLVLGHLASSIGATPGVRLMNVHADPDHHRSVFSFLGEPASVQRAALALAAAALEAIDMRVHRGSHPRLGALDVVPFVPMAGLTMQEAVGAARAFGAAVARRHRVPVFFYGHAATTPDRRRLPDARRGGYEGLPERLRSPAGQPDAGPADFDARSGAVLVGARDVLVAFNVWLDADDLAAARAIAAAVRESSGGLPAVQALGMPLPSRGIVQVSMNLLDYRRTSIPRAFDAVAREAARRAIGVRRAELVGVAPRAAFAGRPPETVGLTGFADDRYLETHLTAATTEARPGAATPGA
jgi:glutamate formiminotransferase